MFFQNSLAFSDPMNVGNLTSGSSAFSKPSLYIWKFLFHIMLKPSLKDFEHNLTSVGNECNCPVVWTFFITTLLGFPGSLDGKASSYNVGDLGLIPGSARSPGEGNGNPLQYSCLENPMDGGPWQATPHGFAKSQTWLKWLSMHTQIDCRRTWWICVQFIIILGCRIHAVVWQLKKTKSKLRYLFICSH